MAEPVLVVDFGTARTGAALVVDGRVTVLREPGSGGYTRSSAVCLTGGGLLVGADADRLKRALPRGYAPNPRRALDTGTALWLSGDQADTGGREVSGGQALAAVLAALRAEAEQACGQPVYRVTLTVPAEYRPQDPRRDALIAAGEAAGLPDVELVHEAYAAVLDTDVLDAPGRGSLVLVCDLGVTWTTTLLRLTGADAAVLGQRAAPDGRDLEDVLLAGLRTAGRQWLEPLLAAGGDGALRAQQDALDLIRALIEQVAGATEAEGTLSPITPPYRLTRDDLDAVVEPAVRGLLEDCRSLVGDAGAILADVAALILVGGWSRTPLAEPLLQNGLGRPMRRASAVRGAARSALGAGHRQLVAASPAWRVAPLTWSIPGGGGRLERWLVDEEQPHEAGVPLAVVRTADDRVVELTATEPGVLLAHRIPAGGAVGPTLAVAAARAPAALAGDPPPKAYELKTDGEWLLTPDRRILLECVDGGRAVAARAVPDGAVLGELRPPLHGPEPRGGRLFIGPDQRPALLAWDSSGVLEVWDLGSGQLGAKFGEPEPPSAVLVNEERWRVAVESPGRSVGRYRRPTTTIWDLASGTQVDRVSDEYWPRKHPGYTDRSAADGFAATAVAPDGLRAAAGPLPGGGAGLTLSDGDAEVFRLREPGASGARVAFTVDGHYLLANWTAQNQSRVELWAV